MGRAFQPGDRVRATAISSAEFDAPTINVGEEHVVDERQHRATSDMYLVGRDWSVTRSKFELVKKPAKARDYVADHARRTLRKAGLTKQRAAVVVQAIQEDIKDGRRYPTGRDLEALSTGGHIDLSKMSRGMHGVTLSQFLWDAFFHYEDGGSKARVIGGVRLADLADQYPTLNFS